MYIYYLIFFLQTISSSQIDIDIPSISSSHTFQLSANTSQNLNRDVLFGLVDDKSIISSSILVRTSFRKYQIQRTFNLYDSSKPQQQQIKPEPIFRSYILSPTFNRSYPFIRVLIASAQGSYEDLQIQPMCATVTAINEQTLYETQTCFISPKTGYCLTTISVLKTIEYGNKNQTTNKIDLYLKVKLKISQKQNKTNIHWIYFSFIMLNHRMNVYLNIHLNKIIFIMIHELVM